MPFPLPQLTAVIPTTLFAQSSVVYPLGTLPSDERALIGGWVGALYGEQGISDDLLRCVNELIILVELHSEIICSSL